MKLPGNTRVYWIYPVDNPNTVLCQICHYNPDMNVVDKIFIGVATCGPRDQFNKDVGRKVSLATAMKSAGWDKAKRAFSWNTYRLMTLIPRWSLTRVKWNNRRKHSNGIGSHDDIKHAAHYME